MQPCRQEVDMKKTADAEAYRIRIVRVWSRAVEVRVSPAALLCYDNGEILILQLF